MHQVAATGAATVVATVRSGEVAPDPVVALWKDGLAERVEVAALGPEATVELLGTVLGGPVDPATAARLSDLCEGNVLYLRELVAGALDDGALRDDGGIWQLVGDPSPSSRLIELVEARLGDLDDHQRGLLELVAYGEPVSQATLAALSDPSVAETLERRGLLAGRLDGHRLQVRLAHPLYGEVVRARTPALRTRAIARSLADTVERISPADPDDALRLASWRLTAGDSDPQDLLDGAAAARRGDDLELAEQLARAAADAGAGFDAELLAALGAGLQGRRHAATELAALGRRAGDDDERAFVAIARFDTSGVWHAVDHDGVLGVASATVTDPAWRDRLTARGLALVLGAEGPRAAVAAALPLLVDSEGEALAFACLVAAHGLARTGRLRAASAVADRGRATREQVDSPLAWPAWWYEVSQCLALLYAGRFHDTTAAAADHHRRAVAEGATEEQAAFAVLEADAAPDRGHVRTALGRAREALAVHQRLDRPVLVRHDLIASALARALAGDAPAAAEDLDRLDALGLPPVLLDEVDLLQARAWTAAAAGDLPGACGHLERAAALGDEIGDAVGAAAALHTLARLGRPRQVVERLAAVVERMDGDLPAARLAHTEALATGDAAALEQATRRFDDMGADLLAAEAAADAAVAHRRDGRSRDAAAAARRAGELAARAEHPVTPALQRGRDPRRPDRGRARDGRPGRRRPRQQGDRRAAAPVAADGRESPATGLRQARRVGPHRAGRGPDALGVTRRAAAAPCARAPATAASGKQRRDLGGDDVGGLEEGPVAHVVEGDEPALRDLVEQARHDVAARHGVEQPPHERHRHVGLLESRRPAGERGCGGRRRSAAGRACGARRPRRPSSGRSRARAPRRTAAGRPTCRGARS